MRVKVYIWPLEVLHLVHHLKRCVLTVQEKNACPSLCQVVIITTNRGIDFSAQFKKKVMSVIFETHKVFETIFITLLFCFK